MAYHVVPKKSLGQHFLKDKQIAQQIAELLPDDDRVVLEIGAGTGNLTDCLLEKAKDRLYVMDIDPDCIAYLKYKYPFLRDRIIAHDFLTFPLAHFFQGQALTVVGNFPYNISSSILFKILEHQSMIKHVVGLFQKEVAQRYVALPCSKIYGIPSVLLQTFYDASLAFTLPPELFDPIPKVESAVITMTRNSRDLPASDQKRLFYIVKQSFGQRRKKLYNSLQRFNLDKLPHDMGHKRAEELSVQDFLDLVHLIEEKEWAD